MTQDEIWPTIDNVINTVEPNFMRNCIDHGTGAEETITQVSTLEALLAGDYQGRLSLRQLLAYGNFGLGTFNRLDGEMILLEGNFFQVKVEWPGLSSLFAGNGSLCHPRPVQT